MRDDHAILGLAFRVLSPDRDVGLVKLGIREFPGPLDDRVRQEEDRAP